MDRPLSTVHPLSMEHPLSTHHPPSMGRVTAPRQWAVESSTEVTALLSSTTQEMVTLPLNSTASMPAPRLGAPRLEAAQLEEATRRLHRP